MFLPNTNNTYVNCGYEAAIGRLFWLANGVLHLSCRLRVNDFKILFATGNNSLLANNLRAENGKFWRRFGSYNKSCQFCSFGELM